MAEDMFEQKKIIRNPLVPLGAMVTGGILVAGLVSFKTGHSNISQYLMRARVLAQGATVALMLATAYQAPRMLSPTPPSSPPS